MFKLKSILPSAMFFILVLGAAHLHAVSQVRQQRNDLMTRLEVVCAGKAQDTEKVLAQLVGATQMGASLIRLGVLDRQSFGGTAEALEAVFPAVESLGMAPGGVLAEIYPLSGREASIGANLLDDRDRSRPSGEAVRTRGPVIVGFFPLSGGRPGLICRTPVIIARDGQDSFWGFITATIALERLINLSGLDRLPGEGYDYRLEKNASQSEGDASLAGRLSETSPGAWRPVSVAGAKFRLLVGPAGPWPAPVDFWSQYLAAVALGLAGALALFRLLGRPALSRAASDVRTAKLRQVNRRLAGELRRRRASARELEASVEIARGMFEDTPAVKLLVDPLSLAVLDANPAAVRFYGWPREVMVGMPVARINAQSPDRIGRVIARAMRGEAGPYLTRHRLATGEVRDVEVFSGPVRKQGSVVLHSVVQDVTAREAALGELKANADRKKEGCQASDRILAEIGHDIRSPLNAAMGFLELTIRTDLEPRQRDNLDMALRSCREIDSTLGSILRPACAEGGAHPPREALPEDVSPGSSNDQPASVQARPGGTPEGFDDMADLLEGMSGTRVLVVDDDPLGRHAVLSTLEMAGLTAQQAGSGPEALSLLAHESFDAVLLDLRMPGMDGYETLAAIRDLPGGGELPVIALSGRVAEEDRLRCFKAGMNDHLSKPVNAAALFASLRQVTAVRRRGDPGGDRLVLDAQAALSLLMGNKSLYVRLLDGFTREYTQTGANMRRLVDAGRLDEAGVLAHSIKGLAANLGGERLRLAALKLEEALDSGAPVLPACLEDFVLALDEFSSLAARTAVEMSGKSDSPPRIGISENL
jgi:PAS domain S-box-containing protein